jgi:hypothetical protein
MGVVVFAALFARSISPAAAQGPLTPGTPVEGTITDVDGESYTIDAKKGQLILINMLSDELDGYLTLSDASSTELASDDSSGEDSSALLAYIAQADGTFTVTATDYFGGASGAFTLIPNVIDPPVIEVNGSIIVTPGPEDTSVYAVFAADADTVVNVWANSQGEDDLALTLKDLNAADIESDDDDGPESVPYVRRVVLPGSGLYLLVIKNAWGDSLTTPLEVFVESTERLFLTETPYAVSLNDLELGTEVFTFEAVNSTVYRITVTAELATGVALELFDTNAFFDPDFESGNAVRLAWDWLSDTDGLVRLDVHPSFFSEAENFTLMIETVQ